jgi:sec-independent protein translocase protein TatA
MFGLRPMELLIILLIVMLLFGATRLPQLGASLGSAIRNFKKGFSEEGPAADEEKKPGALASSGTVEKDVSSKAHSHQG